MVPKFCSLSKTKSINKQNPHIIICGEDFLQWQVSKQPGAHPSTTFQWLSQSSEVSEIRADLSLQCLDLKDGREDWGWRLGKRLGYPKEKGSFESREQGKVEMRAQMINTWSSDWFWSPKEKSQDFRKEELEKTEEDTSFWERVNSKSASSIEYSSL